MNANVVMREKSRHRETEIRKLCLTRNDTVNPRIRNAIAKEVTEDLLEHHTMHAHRASLFRCRAIARSCFNDGGESYRQ